MCCRFKTFRLVLQGLTLKTLSFVWKLCLCVSLEQRLFPYTELQAHCVFCEVRAQSLYICLMEINISVRKAIPWLRLVVACFYRREPDSFPGQFVVICCRQFCTWTGFRPSSSVFPSHCHFTMAPYSSSYTRFSYQKDKWKKPGRMLSFGLNV